MNRKFGISFILLMAMISNSVAAEKVFKWQDKDGVVHYSTEAPFQGAKPVKLPPIMRGEVKLADQALISCKEHGGIDCQAGRDDTDGSVICYDGFKGASALYRFNCNAPKLSVAKISDLTPEGTFSVTIRNTKSVMAYTPTLFVKYGRKDKVQLVGPSEIEPFGIAEFVLDSKDKEKITGKPSLAQLQLDCTNCS